MNALNARGRRPRESKGHPPQSRSDTEAPRLTAQAEHPAQDEIARRAYELYLERGAQDGHDVDDWLRAEAELAPARS